MMMYGADATTLEEYPGAIAAACMVLLEETRIGVPGTYKAETPTTGALPSTVK